MARYPAQRAAAESAADSKLVQQTRKLDKQKKQAESLLKQCEFASAIDILENMTTVKHPKLAKYSRWAKQQLPAAKRGPQEMRESSGALFRTGEQLFERNDYEQAAEILQQVPKKFRSPETKELLQECLDRQAEIVVLLEDIDHAESLEKYDDLIPTVERLLELKPNDRRAKKLLKELKTYGKGGGGMRLGHGDGRFDAVGSTFNPVKAVLFIAVPLAIFGAVSWATVDYIKSNNQTIKIEIDDPSAKVIIDGDVITITGVGDTVTLNGASTS